MSARAKKDEWKVLSDVSYKGVIYSRGSKLPAEMDEQMRARLEARGVIERIGGPRREAIAAVGTSPEDKDLLQYLRGHDAAVVFRIRADRPDAAQIARMRDMAILRRRSAVLIEALRLAAGDPVDEKERRGPVRRSA